MKMKKLTALAAAAAMLGTMAFALPATAAETTLLSHPMDSETAVNAVKTGYEYRVAKSNGGADLELVYNSSLQCMQVTDKGGTKTNEEGVTVPSERYNSAGIKYDITDTVNSLSDKTGTLTISMGFRNSQGGSGDVTVGFLKDSETSTAETSSKTTVTSGFENVSYSCAIPSYSDKLYFYVTNGNPWMFIKNVKLTYTTPDPVATLPINDATFTADSIPNYYSTTGTGGLSVNGDYLQAQNTNGANIDANNEFITINLGEEQLQAGDKLNIGFTYSNKNANTPSAAKVYLDCGDATVEVGSTEEVKGSGGLSVSYSGTAEIPSTYTSGAVKIVLKVSASTGTPKIKDVTVSKAETPVTPATHEEGFTFTKTVSLDELNALTFTITAKEGETVKTGTYTPNFPTTSGGGDAVITGLIITDVPEGTEITSIAFN